MGFNLEKSGLAFNKAQKHIPGGVNSPVRAFKSVGGNPIFMESGNGSMLKDIDGNQYIDLINSWGPMIVGHGHETVVNAVREQAKKLFTSGTPTELETEMAMKIKSFVDNVDLVRLVSSGTEACMSAIRLARGYTGKNKFIKFAGNYHGHADCFLVKAGSGLATFDIDNVPGVTEGVGQDTLIAEYNDIDQVREIVGKFKDEIAAIILEPVAGNMGCILPTADFLVGLRRLCDENGIVLIFDEVMTGFRLGLGGAQEALGVKADLMTYGKVIGGGMPIGAFGGKREIMESIAPLGKVYQAGTLSGNPLAVSAGLATLDLLGSNPEWYFMLDNTGKVLAKELQSIFDSKSIPLRINRIGSMISLHFTEGEVTNYTQSAACNHERFNKYFHHMLKNGVYLPPSSYESWFFNIRLEWSHIEKILDACQTFEL